MTEEQIEKLREILTDLYDHCHSIDSAFDEVVDLIDEIRSDTKREVE